jgi:hypothetical protein
MRLNHGMIALMLSATALASASAMSGCASGGLVYDSYSDDYHRWNHDEDRYYRQWESGTHRDHMDLDRRSTADQSAYWGWRHTQAPDGRAGTTGRSHR